MAQRFGTLLGSNAELRPLISRAQSLVNLQRQFAAVAPAYLAQSCTMLGLNFGTLSISAANPSVAAKLRQLAPELVVLLQNKGCEVSGILVKVQVAYSPPPAQQQPRELSGRARNELGRLVAALEESPLKSALARISGKKAR